MPKLLQKNIFFQSFWEKRKRKTGATCVSEYYTVGCTCLLR